MQRSWLFRESERNASFLKLDAYGRSSAQTLKRSNAQTQTCCPACRSIFGDKFSSRATRSTSERPTIKQPRTTTRGLARCSSSTGKSSDLGCAATTRRDLESFFRPPIKQIPAVYSLMYITRYPEPPRRDGTTLSRREL